MKRKSLVALGVVAPILLVAALIGFTSDLIGDLNNDGRVDAGDLFILENHWDETEPAGDGPPGDLDGDHHVGDSDLLLLLRSWGAFVIVPTPTQTPVPTMTHTPTEAGTPTDTPTEGPTETASPTVVVSSTESIRVAQVVQDAFILSARPFENFGDRPLLRVHWNPAGESESVALLQFDTTDLPPFTEVITAELSLVLMATQEHNQVTVTAYPVLGPWEEMFVNWDMQPPIFEGAAGRLTTGISGEQRVFMNLTPLVREWIWDPEANHGVALRISGEVATLAVRTFGSRESDGPPQLNIAYRIPRPEYVEVPPATPTPIPDHSEVVLSAEEMGYTRYEGIESFESTWPNPGALLVSIDIAQPLIESSLIRFDLSPIPAESQVYQASLELFLEDGDNAHPVRIMADMMDYAWAPEQISWASAAMFYNGEAAAPRGSALVGLDPGLVSMDVTRVVRRWMEFPEKNKGFLLHGEDAGVEGWWRMFTAPGGGTGPRLIVRYGNPVEKTEIAAPTLPPLSQHCPLGELHLALPPPLRKNWSIIDPMITIAGIAGQGHVSHKEWPSSHTGHDLCFDVQKNSANAWAMVGDDMEMEWETQCWPVWAWPTRDDEVIVYGPLVYDCGHGTKTEIHPPRGVVTVRDNVAADMSTHGGIGTVLLNRADVFFSNRRTKAYCGGYCEHGEPTYIPVNDRDYSFDLKPLTNGDTTGELKAWVEYHPWSWGTHVAPVVTVDDTPGNTNIHVELPYKTKYGSNTGSLHTSCSIYYGWTRTRDPDLRAFKVALEGVQIIDDSEPWCCGYNGGDYHIWMNVNDQWFNLNQYVPAIDGAGAGYYAVKKPLAAHVIVPNTSFPTSPTGRISIRTNGYESDYYDSLYGWDSGAYLFALAWKNDNDTIRRVDVDFEKKDGFGVGGPTTYVAQGDQDGQYGLRLKITEEAAPFQARFIAAGITGATVDLNSYCDATVYQNSTTVQFPVTSQTSDVDVTTAYDQDALYVCFSDVPATVNPANPLGDIEAVIYLDPDTPSKAKVGSKWIGRDDDIRIAFRTFSPSQVTVYAFDRFTSSYTIPLDSNLVNAAVGSLYSGRADVQFQIDKSLIPRGPWSTTQSEESLVNKGIGAMFAIEEPGAPRHGAWPAGRWPLDAHWWGRLWFDLDCPVTLWAERIGPMADNSRPTGSKITVGPQPMITKGGDTVTVKLKYQVGFGHPRCNLINSILKAEWPSEFSLVDYTKQNAIYDGTTLAWSLPASATEGTYIYTLRQILKCETYASPGNPCEGKNYATAGGTLSATFASSYVPPTSVTRHVAIAECICPHGLPDMTMWKSDFPIGTFPPWFLIHDPIDFGDPTDLIVNIRNEQFYGRTVGVQAIEVPLGVGSAELAANPNLNFAEAPVQMFEVPANAEINARIQMEMPGSKPAGKPQTTNLSGGAVAVRVFDPDRGDYATTVRQLVSYVPMTAGENNAFPITVWHTLSEPAPLRLDAWAYQPGWECRVEPELLPAKVRGASSSVTANIRPPRGATLGSGHPIDIVAWSEDSGEFAGMQRILDLPAVQFSVDQPRFANGDITLEPAVPGMNEEAVVCAVLRNRSESAVGASVEFRKTDILSTAPLLEEILTETSAEVPPGETVKVCSDPFTWGGSHSFQVTLRQPGYRDQVIRRNVGTVSTFNPGITGCLPIGEATDTVSFGLESVVIGQVLFVAGHTSSGSSPINLVDCSGDDLIDVDIPSSDPIYGPAAHAVLLPEICGGNTPPHVEVFLTVGSLTILYGIDDDGTVVDTKLVSELPGLQQVILESESGIRTIAFAGSEICVSEICWGGCPAPPPYGALLEVRNPLEEAHEIILRRTPVGLPDWTVDMPEVLGLGPGEATEIEVILFPPEWGLPYAGDESRVEIEAVTPDGEVTGGAWVQVLR